MDPQETRFVSIRDRLAAWVRRWLALACAAIALWSGGCGERSADSTSARAAAEDPLVSLEAAIRARDWQRADRFVKDALIANPGDPDVLSKVAAVNAYCGRRREAAFLLVDAARLANFQPASRVTDSISALINVGEVYPAIELLEESLATHPEQSNQRRILVGLYGEVQRADRIPGHLKKLIQDREFDVQLLVAVTETSSRRLSEKTAARMLERNPEDHRVRLADAFLHLYRRNADSAAEVLEEILEHHPDFAPAHAMYGQSLAMASRWSEIPQWLERTPAESDQFADYWLTLGDVAAEGDQPAEAARAYWEAGRRDPNRIEAWTRLRFSILRLREDQSKYGDLVSDEQLRVISDHVDRRLQLRERFNDFEANERESQVKATEVARVLFALGRVWEAEAWSAAATTLVKEPSQELAGLRVQILARLRRDPAWFAEETPILAIDLSGLPRLRIESDWAGSQRMALVPPVESTDHLRMSESSVAWGLESVGQGNNPSDPQLGSLIRSTGVGGGAIDYDLDGLPDLLVMNAGGTILKSDSMPNELMRNLGSMFVRVTDHAGVGHTGFGQGVAVGDFNEDGFADLFFANMGNNVLMQNNGDGSFTDVTDRIEGDVLNQWSTSASFVDIDQDAIADLVVARYCKAMPNIDRPCPNDQGILDPCHPLVFPAEADQVFRGTASGRLVNVTDDWVEPSAPGRGLGIVAGTLDGQQLGIFIANDMSRNGFYTTEVDAENRVKLIDSAAARGVAVDGRALNQASMGIASSDFDHDGDLDLYVTGFGREYNVYYEQISPGLWKDETSALKLIQPTLTLIGFGTQAIDIDNDGIEEIIVTNGHIGEFSDPEAPPYEQPLQIFRRVGDGSFALVNDDAWGNYFRNSHVGRGLWTTDVNRDGRNDVFITHSNEQVALLVNETEDHNDMIAFKLVATDSSRDAIGAVIRFKSQGQPRTLWQLSGDGYFCSNEKTLIAGLGEADEVTDVTVTWQDGSIDTMDALPTNTQYLIVQGQGEAFGMYEYDR